MKYFISILGLVAVVGFGYFAISNSISTAYGQSASNFVPETSDVSVAGARVLALLNRLNNIKLDDKIFSDPLFTGLQDWTITINPQQIGRANPYLPTGNVGTVTNPKTKVPSTKSLIKR